MEKINPFPKVDMADFTLATEWYLPQHLGLLRQKYNNPNLIWDFSSKPPEEQLMYERVFSTPWRGNLEFLFYRTPGRREARFLPEKWLEDKALGHISFEEAMTWDNLLCKIKENEMIIKENSVIKAKKVRKIDV